MSLRLTRTYTEPDVLCTLPIFAALGYTRRVAELKVCALGASMADHLDVTIVAALISWHDQRLHDLVVAARSICTADWAVLAADQRCTRSHVSSGAVKSQR